MTNHRRNIELARELNKTQDLKVEVVKKDYIQGDTDLNACMIISGRKRTHNH